MKLCFAAFLCTLHMNTLPFYKLFVQQIRYIQRLFVSDISSVLQLFLCSGNWLQPQPMHNKTICFTYTTMFTTALSMSKVCSILFTQKSPYLSLVRNRFKTTSLIKQMSLVLDLFSSFAVNNSLVFYLVKITMGALYSMEWSY